MTDTPSTDVPRDVLARHLRDSLGMAARLRIEGGVPLFTLSDSPSPGMETHATLGLSSLPLKLDDGTTARHGAELLLAAAADESGAADALAEVARQVAAKGKALLPGMILTDVLAGRPFVAPHLRHLLLAAPFLWVPPPGPLRLPERLVVLFQAIPISEPERQVALREGGEELEDMLEEAEADILDFARPSVA